jgi:hypothetical protein
VNETLDFLELVLPPEGDHWYVAAVFRNNRVTHRWHTTRLALASCLCDENANGATAYFAAGVYRARSEGRKQSNSAGASSLWSDIDAGEGKQYATAADARNALVEVCEAERIPRPLGVCSGRGIHAYWPLQTILDPETWKIYSGGLASILRRAGIKHERTTDLASLLRPVGTHNRKHATPAPVTLLDQPRAVPYQLAQLESLLDAGPERVRTQPAGPINGHSLAGRLGAIVGGGIRYSSRVVKECPQLRAPFVDSRGYVPEPLWHAALGVFAFIEGDGDEAAHHWSADDDRYNSDQTQKRLDRIRATTTGATTCEHFHQANPQTCETCRYWQTIKSPITLCTRTHQSDEKQVLEVKSEAQITVPLPEPYEWNEHNSLCLGHEDRNGNHVATVISKHSIYLDCVYEREGKDKFAYGYKQHIPNRGWHNIVIGANALRSSGGLGELSEQGANIGDFSAFIKYTIAAIDMQYEPGQQVGMLYEQFGWKDNDTSFLYGANLYTPAEIREVVVGKDIKARTAEDSVGPCRRGSLAEWSDLANKLFASGTEAQSVCLCASFGSVLHRFLARDEGGAVVSLVTHGGGKGKSTALAGSLSVWGRKEGLSIQNIDSSISKGATLASIGNIPLFYDEFETCDPSFVREFVRMFTNGKDKRRMGRDGVMKDTGLSWQTCLFTASNASLIDSIASTGNDVLSSRIWEMSTDVPDHLKSMFQGDRLKDTLRTHSGHAGDAFLSKLVQPGNVAAARHELEKWHSRIEQSGPFTTEHRFWIRLAATVAVAAEIITSGEKILSFDAERIVKWLVDQMAERVKPKSEDEWALDILGQFVNQHSQNQIVVDGPFIPGQTAAYIWVKPTRELYIRKERDGGKVYIDREALQNWCVKRGINTREFIENLINNGVCVDQWRKVTLGAGTDYTSMRVRTLQIDGQHPKVSGLFHTESADVVPFRRREHPNSDEDLEVDMPY